MRRLPLLVVVGSLLVGSAGSATASPAKPSPIELRSQARTETVLKDRGFLVSVLWRIGHHQDIVVADYGGGPTDPLERVHQIETAVWTVEPYRFDRLVIENHTGTKARLTVTYKDLRATMGPRAGFGDLTVGTVLALAGYGSAFTDRSRNDPNILLVAGTGVGLLALLALVVVVIIGRGRRIPDEAEHRLFA